MTTERTAATQLPTLTLIPTLTLTHHGRPFRCRTTRTP